MTLTADEIMRIWKVARYNAYRERMGFKDGTKNELWNKDLKPIDQTRTKQEEKDALADIEDIMEAEQEDGLG